MLELSFDLFTLVAALGDTAAGDPLTVIGGVLATALTALTGVQTA